MPETEIVGQGRLGFASGLPVFLLLGSPTGPRPVSVIVKPAHIVPGFWNNYSPYYSITYDTTFGGKKRDVLSVRTPDSVLVRASSVAQAQANEGYYYFNPDEGQTLTVHLDGGGNPDDTEIVAVLGFFFSNEDVSHPALGAAMSGTVTYASSGTGFSQTATVTTVAVPNAQGVRSGASEKLSSAGNAGYQEAILTFQGLVPGAKYRFRGAYRLDADLVSWPASSATLTVQEQSGFHLAADGRSWVASNPFSLLAHRNEWRRFVADFVALTSEMYFRFRLTTSASGSPSDLYFDEPRLHRIFRFEPYERRLVEGLSPELAAGTSGANLGSRTVSNISIQIAIGDGVYDTLQDTLTWEGQEVEVLVGGAGDGGLLVPTDDMFPQFKGEIEDVDWSEDVLALGVESSRYSFHRELPLRQYDDDFWYVRPAILGLSRPMLFGTKLGLRPTKYRRIEEDADDDKYGSYEVADCDRAPNGIGAISAVYVYESEEAAQQRSTAGRITLVYATDYVYTLAEGSFQLTADVGPYRVDELNQHMNIYANTDSGYLVATVAIPTGLYTADGLAAAIDDELSGLSALGIDDLACSYSSSTNKFSITKASGTLALLIQSGANAETSIWGLIGFTGTEDLGAWVITTDFNDTLAFLEDGVPLDAILTSGTYTTGEELAEEIQTQMNAEAAPFLLNTYRVTYSTYNKKFLIARDTGSADFSLLDYGSLMEEIGYDADADRNPASRYEAERSSYGRQHSDSTITFTGDVATYNYSTDDKIISCDAIGYRDDGAGTYTGTAYAIIEKAPDIAKALADRWLGLGSAAFEAASLTAGRTFAPQALSVYITDPTSSRDIFQRLEDSVLARIEALGSGALRFVCRDGEGASTVNPVTITETDVLPGFGTRTVTEEVFTGVKVRYDEDPVTKASRVIDLPSATASAKYPRKGKHTVDTYIADEDDAQDIADRYLAMITRPWKTYAVPIGPKALGVELGDVVFLDLPRAPVAAGLLSAAEMRVIGYKKDAISGLSFIVLLPNDEV